MSLDPEEQHIRELIYNQQMVCGGRLASQHKDFDENSYRILEEPLSTLLAEDLITGSWTIEELSEKYGIHKKDIWNVLTGLMKDPWVLESGYIPRRTGRDEREGHRIKSRYSFIPIPTNARIFDPTLGFSLLGWSEFLCETDHSFFFPKNDEISDSYCQKIASFWEVPPEKIKTIFEKHELQYLPTVYGPLPVLESNELYTSIKRRIEEEPDLLVKRFRRRNFDKEYEMYRQFLIQGCGTIPELQYYVVFLHDILVSCNILEDKSNFERFSEINRILFSMICNIPLQTETLNKSENSDDSNLLMSNELQEEFNKAHSSGVTPTRSQRQNLNKIEQALKSPVLHERVSAVRQMRKGIVPPDIPLLKIALKDVNSSVQMEALKAIRECLVPFPPSILYPVAIHSKDRLVRYAAVDFISSIASPEALETLEKVALNSPLDNAKRALLGIARNQPKVAGPFLHNIMVNTNDLKVRVAALKLIEAKQYHEIIPLLIKYLNDPQLSVRTASLSALVPVGTTEVCDALKKRYSFESSSTLKKLLKQEIIKIDPNFHSTDPKQTNTQSESQKTLDYQVETEDESPQKHQKIISEREMGKKCENHSNRTYDSLSEDLMSEDIPTRQAAIKYLGEHFSPNFTSLIIKGLENVFSVQHTALAIISEHNLLIPAECYLPTINSHRQITKETVRILGQIPIKGGANLLKSIILKYQGGYAKEATFALLSYPEKETVPILKELFHEKNVDIKANSAEALGKIKAFSAFDDLIEGLNNSRYIVRLSCMEALSNMECQNIREILQEQLNNDPSKQIRKVAAHKLALMGQDISTVSQPIKTVETIESITGINFPSETHQISPFIGEYNLKGLKSKPPGTCIETIQQLGTVKDPAIIKRQIDIMVNDRTIENQISALKYLENIEDPQILASIMASFKKSFSKLRIAMVPIIAQKGGEKGLEFLAEHLNDLNSQVREEICQAFQNYGNSSHNHILEKLLLDPSNDVSNAAKIAIKEIGIRESRANLHEKRKSPTLKKFSAIHIGSKNGMAQNLSELIAKKKKNVSNAGKKVIPEIQNSNYAIKSPSTEKFSNIKIGSKKGISQNISEMSLGEKKDVSNAEERAIYEIQIHERDENPNYPIKYPSTEKFCGIKIGSKIGISQNLSEINKDEKKDVETPTAQNLKNRSPKLGHNLGRLELEVLQSDLKNRHNSDEQMNSAYELGISKDIRAPQLLIEALDENNPSVLYEVLTALGELGDPRACPHLKHFLESQNNLLRETAAHSLEKLGCFTHEEMNMITTEHNYVPKDQTGEEYKIGKESLKIE